MNVFTQYAKLVEEHGLDAVLGAAQADFDWQRNHTPTGSEADQALIDAQDTMYKLRDNLQQKGAYICINNRVRKPKAVCIITDYTRDEAPYFTLVVRSGADLRTELQRHKFNTRPEVDAKLAEVRDLYDFTDVAEHEWIPTCRHAN